MRFIRNDDMKNLREVTSTGLINSKGTAFDPEGIYSPSIFGSDEYSCDCGSLKGAWHSGVICQKCNSTISNPKDNIYKSGRFKIPNGFKIFNPIIYLMMQKYIKNFENMINPQLKHITMNGNTIYTDKNGQELLNFIDFTLKYKETIDKILDEDAIKSDERLKIFKNFLLNNEDSVMLDSIPILPLHLRPSQLSVKQFHLEPINKCLISINTHIHSIIDNISEDDISAIEQELFEIQRNYIDMYDKIVTLISTKDGLARDQILSNKINFSGRAVISVKHDNDPTTITIPKLMFSEIYLPRILTFIVEHMGISYTNAIDYYYHNRFDYDNKMINDAIDEILLTKPIVLLNRNPSLHLLSIQAFYISGVTNDYTIKLAKPVLQSFNADFDSDFIIGYKI